ncbi:MAG: hypothetical protein CBC88_02320 [Candidatus Pelagibacter sp. TMED128]|nr:MAG: hypothetical protein CBC88_02320 [Candidatus Pelagibacter sp. TMED128]
MAKFNDKISTILNSQLPEFVVADHPKFAEFLKVYYQLLESAELSIDTIEGTDGILLQSETGQTNNLVLNSSRKDTARTLLDAGDKILLEESTYGKFTRGETITGQTSKATAVVLVEDITNNRLIISAQDKFAESEIVVGSSSGAQANITNYKPNPVNNIVDLVNFRDPDNAISYFLTNMRDEFLATLPEQTAAGVDKRKLIKNIKSMYRSKGSVRGHAIFFRILFGENSETIYPREQMLKASDGQFDSLKVLRVISSVGDPNQLIGRTITGGTSGATAIIENTSQFQIGASTVTQLILNSDSILGTFTVGEEVTGTSADTDDYFIKANITGIPGNKNITNDGSLNATTDTISITAGGEGALFQVEEIGPGSVTDIVIDNAGTGYEIGDALTFTNTDTGGGNATGFVKVVNGGFADQNGSVASATGVEDRIVLEDETTRGDPYQGVRIVQEKFTGLQTIDELFLTNGGSQYTSLPTVSVTSSTGSNATVRAFGTDIGKVVKVKTVEVGRSFENSPTPPTLGFFNNGIVTSVSGTFLATNSITSSSGGSGTIVNLDADRGLLKIKDVTGTFAIDDTLTSATSGTCTLKKLDVASASVDVVSVADTDGAFISERGKLSETTMRIQDSLYYQDFSYVIKVGQSIARWRDAFKKTMHTAGFYFTGQVDIESRITVTAGGPVKGVTSGREETPFLQIANTLFSTIFGRRLGTSTDGTSLRANAHLEGSLDVSNDFRDPFSSNTRDLTVTREGITIDYLSRPRNIITDNSGVRHDVRSGYAYGGPRYSSLNRYANTAFGTSATGSYANTFQNLNALRVTGTKTTLDGQPVPIFLLTSNTIGKTLSMKYAFPTQTGFNQNLFSNTLVRFDSNTIKFDDTNP